MHDPSPARSWLEGRAGSEADAEDAIQSTAAAIKPMGALPSHADFTFYNALLERSTIDGKNLPES